MNNLLKIENFIKEYYQPAPLTNSSMVRLYRGDSNYIDKYDPEKFDKKSLFGAGTYLTASRYIASTYTTKGGSDKVICHFYCNGTKGKDARLKFIIYYYLSKAVTGKVAPLEWDLKTNKQKELDEYYGSLAEWFNRPKLPTHRFDNNEPISEKDIQEYNDYYDKIEAEKRPRAKSLARKYNKYLKVALQEYKKDKKFFTFHIKSYSQKDASSEWEVIDKRIKQGHISEFDVPKTLVENCYDAESTLSEKVLKLVENIIFEMYERATTGKDEYSVYGSNLQELIEDYEYDKERNPQYFSSLGVLFYNSYYSKTRKWKDYEWNSFKLGMQDLGYTGIRYQGGKYTGSPTKHEAYVLWDFDKLIRVH